MFEIWSWTIVPGDVHRSDAHSRGTCELISVVRGSLKITVGSGTMTLQAGQAARFVTDQPHSYAAADDQPVSFSMAVLERAEDGYRYATMLMRTGADYEIELPVTTTPLGAISRLEHALAGFESEQVQYRQRVEDAELRLTSYRSRQGGEFGFSGELAEKSRQLADIENDLASSIDGQDARSAA
ncbi:cupin domain-containing protein [Mesorhizobium sp. M0614]|uniref:cupin domain-containing protein n=1 Tax=Mesorhizobium sp. M0614 TaxID=2956970 RepID=UPI003339E384